VPALAQRWAGGVKAGVGQGGFSGSREFDWNRTIPTTSVFLTRGLTDRLSFQLELAHVRRVGVSNLPGSALTLTADYLQLPLLLQLELPSTAGLMPFLLGGPSLGVKLKCTLEFVGGGVRSSDDCDSQRGLQSHRLDAGVVGGGGVAWAFGAAMVSVEARYAAGLRSFVVPLDQQNSKSYGWSVLAGVSLPLRPVKVSRPRTPVSPVPTLPPLRQEPFMLPPIATQPVRPAPVARTSWERRVTVNGIDVDARTLLLAIAKEAGLNVVVSSDVRARVSLSLTNVPAVEAVQAIIDVAGLSIMSPQSTVLPTVVFHHRPTDVNKASPEVITARFGVSAEMAKWIAANRPDAPRTP